MKTLETFVNGRYINGKERFNIQILVPTSKVDVQDCLKRLKDSPYFILDSETFPDISKERSSGLDPYTAIIRLLQIGVYDHSYIFDRNILGEELIRDTLIELNEEKVIKYIYGATFDLKMIKSNYGIWLNNVVCVATLSRALGISIGPRASKLRGHSLKSMSRDFFDIILDKQYQTSDWGGELSDEQIKYAALDTGYWIKKFADSVKDQFYKDMPEGFESREVYDLDVKTSALHAKIEYRGMPANKELFEVIIAQLEKKILTCKVSLCKALNLEIRKELILDEEGELKLVEFISEATSTLLNNNVGLKFVLNELDEDLNLDNLKAETLKIKYDCLKGTSLDIIKKLIDYKIHIKLLSDCNKYLKAINPITGRIHSDFIINGAGTGRTVSTSHLKVNLQQVNKHGVLVESIDKNILLSEEDIKNKLVSLRDCFSSNKEDGVLVVCLTGDTLISTNRGYMSARDCYYNSSDSLRFIDNKGQEQRIINKGKSERQKYTVTTNSGQVIDCSSDHRFLVWQPSGHSWVKAENLALGYVGRKKKTANRWVCLNKETFSKTNCISIELARKLALKKPRKEVPLEVLQSSREVIVAYLIALIHSGFIVFERFSRVKKEAHLRFKASYRDFIVNLQTLFLAIGVKSTVYRILGLKGLESIRYVLIINNRDSLAILRELGLDEDLYNYVTEINDYKNPYNDFVLPYKLFRSVSSYKFKEMRNFLNRGYIGMKDLKRVPIDTYNKNHKDYDLIMSMVNGRTLLDLIKKVEATTEIVQMYDFEVEGHIIIANNFITHNCDWGGQELRVAAALSKDEVMLETLWNQKHNPYIEYNNKSIKNPLVDLHTVAALSIFPKLNDLTLDKLGDGVKERNSNGVKFRDVGKIFNFSVIYGASSFSLAEDLKCSDKEAEEFLNKYFEKFFNLASWLKREGNLGKKRKWIRNTLGRIIYVNEANNKGDVNSVARRAPNAQVQGLSSEMMKIAENITEERLDLLNTKYKCSSDIYGIIAPVHDELVCWVPGKIVSSHINKQGDVEYEFDEIAYEYSSEIENCMEEAMGYILDPIVGYKFPSIAEAKPCFSWAEK